MTRLRIACAGSGAAPPPLPVVTLLGDLLIPSDGLPLGVSCRIPLRLAWIAAANAASPWVSGSERVAVEPTRAPGTAAVPVAAVAGPPSPESRCSTSRSVVVNRCCACTRATCSASKPICMASAVAASLCSGLGTACCAWAAVPSDGEVENLQGDTFSISPEFLGAYMGDSAGKVP
eukprot:SAG31_NODE_1423_length_8400_cov_2.665944_5_plen_176_part_00